MKTSISLRIEHDRSLPRLEMDGIREHLFKEGTNTPEERQVSYASMHFCAERLLRCGVPRVLLVATYQPWQQRERAASLAEDLQSSLLIIQLKVDPDDAARRFCQRPEDHPAKDLTAARVRQLADWYKYYHRGLIVDTSRLKFDEVYRAVAEALDLKDGTIPGPVPRKLFAEWVESAREGQR